MGAWKKPATEAETIYMENLHKIISSVTGIPREKYCSEKKSVPYVRCRQIFAYNCHLQGIENIVMDQSVNRCHSAMTKYIEHYPKDYEADYKGFRYFANMVTKKLKKEDLSKVPLDQWGIEY